MLRLVDIKKIFPEPDGKDIVALQSVTYEFPKTGLVGIVGRSGSGKTTLLNLIGGADLATSGKIFWNDQELSGMLSDDKEWFRTWIISYVFQDYNLISGMSVIDNIKLALRFQYDDEDIIREKSKEALEIVGLADQEKRMVKKLSGGQQQRVAIARALAKESAVILCDEPTGNLDAETADEIMSVLKKISATRLVIMVTHDNLLADSYCDEILRLDRGRLSVEKESEKSTVTETVESPKKENKHRGLSLKNLLRYAFYFLRKNKISAALILIVAIGVFSAIAVFNCVSDYAEGKSLYNTLKDNNYTVFPITRYIDKVVPMDETGERYGYGPSAEYLGVTEKNENRIREQLGKNTSLYKAYFFYKPLDDFSKKTNFQSGLKQDNCFREFIAIDDYTKVMIQLTEGRLPQTGNEVLITDYMARNILLQQGFDGVTSESDLVDRIFKDRHTGFEMRVVGIIRTEYKHYLTLAESDKYSEFVDDYLAGLQSVWGLADFVPDIVTDGKWFSVEDRYFMIEGQNDVADGDSPVHIITDISSLNFVGTFNRYDDFVGILLTKGQLARLLRVDVTNVDAGFVNENIGRVSLNMETLLTMKDKTRVYPSHTMIGVIGIIDDESDTDEILCYERGDADSFWLIPNGEFRQFYCGLSGEYKKDIQLLQSLVPEEKSDEFYLSHKDYYKEGYMMYSPFLTSVEDVSEYLLRVTALGKKIVWIIVAITIVAMVIFGVFTIKKSQYEIGLFSSLGASKKAIGMIFGTEIVFLTVLSLFVTLLISNGVVQAVNNRFVQNAAVKVRLFDWRWQAYWLPLVSGIGIAVISIFAAVCGILVLQPAKLMKFGKK